MEKILIISDSACDIPKDEAERYGILILPVMVSYGGKTYAEFYDIVPQEYWKVLEEIEEIPTTAQVTLSSYLEAFKNAQKDGYTHILCLLMNAHGSGTYAAGCTARELFYSENGNSIQIELLDSGTYSYVYGQIAVNSAKMRDQGLAFDEIVKDSRDKISKAEAYLAVYSLKHLKKSGRISGGAAFAGEVLGLKPISHVINGEVSVIDKVRGDHALIPRVVEHIQKRIVSPESQTIILLYSDVEEDELKKAEQLLLNQVGVKEIRRIPLGPSITTNSGPHSIGIAFYGEARKA
ncbi:MAG: DegV family protein [Clostridiales bacterium]|nr:DegV family protein [Clostridiales bacterium]